MDRDTKRQRERGTVRQRERHRENERDTKRQRERGIERQTETVLLNQENQVMFDAALLRCPATFCLNVPQYRSHDTRFLISLV